MGFPGGSDCKEYACNAGDLGLIPGLGGNDNRLPLQYSCLENSMDRAWGVTVHEHTHTHRAFLIGQLVKILPAMQET